MLKTLSRILAKEGGFTVVGVARDGCQALHHTLALAPELVLIDQHLPQLNGAQAAQYIKHFAKPPVVFMVTADDNPGSRAMCEGAGADAFVVKSAGLRSQLKLRFQKTLDPEAAHRQDPEGRVLRMILPRSAETQRVNL